MQALSNLSSYITSSLPCFKGNKAPSEEATAETIAPPVATTTATTTHEVETGAVTVETPSEPKVEGQTGKIKDLYSTNEKGHRDWVVENLTQLQCNTAKKYCQDQIRSNKISIALKGTGGVLAGAYVLRLAIKVAMRVGATFHALLSPVIQSKVLLAMSVNVPTFLLAAGFLYLAEKMVWNYFVPQINTHSDTIKHQSEQIVNIELQRAGQVDREAALLA